MKHFKLFLLSVLFLSFSNVQGIHAQGFFKQLLEAAGSILEDTPNSSSSTGNSSSSNSGSSSSSKAGGYIPNVNFRVTECEYWGDDVLVRFVMTNTSSEDIEILIYESSDGDGHTYVAYDENNNKRSYVPVVGGKVLTGLGDGYSAKLPAGIPVKGYFDIRNVPASITKINRISIAGIVNPGKPNIKEYSYQIGEQTVTYAKNTNRDNIFLSMPIVNYAYTKAYRSGKDVVLEGTLTNKGASDMNMRSPYSDDNSSIYDSEGNAYKAYIMIGANELSAFSDTRLPADIPVKCKVVVKNVPASIHEFSIVKKYFEIGDPYYLQFKNLKF